MMVNVTQKHIECGVRRACGLCPISLSIKEAAGDRKPIVIVHDYIFIAMDYNRNKGVYTIKERYSLPPEAKQFISDFDASRPVSPFSFEATPFYV